MIVVPNDSQDQCCSEGPSGMTRRDILRVGGSGVLGMGLGAMLQAQAHSATSTSSRRASTRW